MKIHTGDTVLVISGKDRGKTGTVLRVLNDRVVVADVNMRTRHIKKRPDQAGSRIRYEASLHVSNVMILDPKTKKPSRIGVRLDEKGHKVRFAKVSGEVLTGTKVKAKAKKGDAKEGTEKEPKKTKKGDIEKVDGPPKKAFWKLGFGADAIADAADVPDKKHDQTIPDQSRLSSSFGHQRGD